MSVKFYKLPQDLAMRKDLNASDKIVFAVILDHQGSNDKCWPGIRTIANKTGLTCVSVIECIRRLESANLVNVERRGNGKSSYYSIAESDKETLPDSVKEIIPVKKPNRLRNLDTTGKETYTEPLKKLKPNQTDSYKTHSVGASTFAFVVKSGQYWQLPQAKFEEYVRTYQALDVEAELRKAAQWLNDNPERRKTVKGMPRFLGGWLSRAKPVTTQHRPNEKLRPFTEAKENAYLENNTHLPTENEADELMRKVGLS